MGSVAEDAGCSASSEGGLLPGREIRRRQPLPAGTHTLMPHNENGQPDSASFRSIELWLDFWTARCN